MTETKPPFLSESAVDDTQGMFRKNTNGGNIRAFREVIKLCVKSFKVLKQDKQLFTMMQTV